MSYVDKIKQLEKEIADLRAADAAFAALAPEHRLAITLHELLCHHNHADGCGWFYEISKNIHNWQGSEHVHYLGKALKVQTCCKRLGIAADDAVNILKIARN